MYDFTLQTVSLCDFFQIILTQILYFKKLYVDFVFKFPKLPCFSKLRAYPKHEIDPLNLVSSYASALVYL